MWALMVCLGVSAFGCGMWSVTKFESEESCYRALREMRFDTPANGAESNAKRNVVAFCRPEK